jgi:NAD(P)-dependent dehydrogenase (short-subunit alcohol dehydrogenase family)
MPKPPRRQKSSLSVQPAAKPAWKAAVFITGVSSGIGKALALQLLRDGYFVMGTVRRPEDGGYLTAAGGMPLVLDVTDHHRIPKIAAQVKASLAGLAGLPLTALVNNAGLSTCASWEDMTMDELRRQLDVNFFGAVEITKAFLPMIRSGHGRIMVISSTSVRLPLALMGAYCASKYALEAFAVTLRQELLGDRIPVICIQPGPIQTPIFEKTRRDLKTLHAGKVQSGFYGPFLKRSQELEATGLKPEYIAERLARILHKPKPPLRAMISRDAWFNVLIPRLPQRLIDFVVYRYLFSDRA